jgi:hypothetical protein
VKLKIGRAAAWPDVKATRSQHNLIAQRFFARRLLHPRVFGLAGHQREKILFGDVLFLQDADVASVTQHGGAIADADQFGDAMRHNQYG